MNTLLNVVFASLFVCVFQTTTEAMSVEEAQAMFLSVVTACKDKEGASENDVLELLTHSIPTTQTGACLNRCVMEDAGIISNGKFSLEGSIKIAELSGKPNNPKNVALIGPECESVVGDDRCDLGRKIMVCLHKACAARGINPVTDLI